MGFKDVLLSDAYVVIKSALNRIQLSISGGLIVHGYLSGAELVDL